MKQRVCQFGPEKNLVGILSEPAGKETDPQNPVVLMLNAGLLHRVGPHRMAVQLAHQLADHGIRSLRFDMGGYGDSEVSTDAKADETRTIADIRTAMDFLEREQGIRRFVLFGSCSGADNSHATALRDPRVIGTVLLDGYGYWTWRSYVTYYLPRLFRRQVWANKCRKLSAPKPEQNNSLRVQLRRPFGPKLQVRDEIQSLVDRGAQMLYFYTGGVESYYNYAGQFFDMFKGLDARGKIDVVYYPYADHIYSFAEDRDRMFAKVVQWLRSRNWHNN